MPTTTNITTTYAGESASKYIAAALLSANTIENGGVTVLPNVKFRATMKKVASDDILKNASCDFNATSTITLTERFLQPKELQVNVQFCKQDFASDWDAVSMGYSAFDNLPPSFQEFIIAHFIAKVAQKNEQNLWQGVVANQGEYDGIGTVLAANLASIPANQKITGIAGGINSGNVIAELGKIVDQIPSALYGNEGLKIYAPQNVVRAYVRSLGGFVNGIGANGVNNQGTQWFNGNTSALTFDGVPIFMANGLPSNKLVTTTTDNLFFGTGVQSDENEVRLLDMSMLDGSQNVRFIMRMTGAANVGILEDVVTYGY
jgi:hypothetical protein